MRIRTFIWVICVTALFAVFSFAGVSEVTAKKRGVSVGLAKRLCIVKNWSFEKLGANPSAPDHKGPLSGVPGWQAVPPPVANAPGNTNSPDVFWPPNHVPTNFIGNETAAHGKNYAGISLGTYFGTFKTEALGGGFSTAAVAGQTYDISVKFSLAEVRPTKALVEVLLYNSSSGALHSVGTMWVTKLKGWQTFKKTLTIPSNGSPFNMIVFRGSTNAKYTLSYVYIDAVKVCKKRPEPPVPGNHFLCYKVEPHEKFKPVDVKLADQFMEWGTAVVRVERVCTPVRKNNSKVYWGKKIHLVCYLIKPGKQAGRVVAMRNQFGKQRFTVLQPTTLCVPSYKKLLK